MKCGPYPQPKRRSPEVEKHNITQQNTTKLLTPHSNTQHFLKNFPSGRSGDGPTGAARKPEHFLIMPQVIGVWCEQEEPDITLSVLSVLSVISLDSLAILLYICSGESPVAQPHHRGGEDI